MCPLNRNVYSLSTGSTQILGSLEQGGSTLNIFELARLNISHSSLIEIIYTALSGTG